MKRSITFILITTLLISTINIFSSDSLLFACATGQIKKVLELLQQPGTDVNLVVQGGYTPLYVACQNGHLAVVQFLLQQEGIKINQPTTDGDTPLFIACQQGHLDIVQLLVENGADVNQARNDGVTPFFVACQNGYLDIARCLFQNGANINKLADGGFSPFYIACQQGHLAVVKFLVDNGALINQAGNKGVTPLFIACQNGHLAVVQFLLQQEGIKINQPTTDGDTPLFIACQQGHLDIVQLLVENGADVNQAVKNGITPFYIACQQGHLAVVQFLLQQEGIKINQPTNDGDTPLYIACQQGHLAVVQLLLAKGADVNQAVTNDADTCLIVAVYRGHIEIVQLLLRDRRVVENIDAQADDGLTALMCAVQLGNFKVIEALLSKGADIFIQDNQSYDAFYYAVLSGRADIINMLFDPSNIGKYDLSLSSKDGLSIIQIAIKAANVKLLKKILEYDASYTIKQDKRIYSLLKDGVAIIPDMVKSVKDTTERLILQDFLDKNHKPDPKKRSEQKPQAKSVTQEPRPELVDAGNVASGVLKTQTQLKKERKLKAAAAAARDDEDEDKVKALPKTQDAGVMVAAAAEQSRALEFDRIQKLLHDQSQQNYVRDWLRNKIFEINSALRVGYLPSVVKNLYGYTDIWVDMSHIAQVTFDIGWNKLGNSIDISFKGGHTVQVVEGLINAGFVEKIDQTVWPNGCIEYQLRNKLTNSTFTKTVFPPIMSSKAILDLISASQKKYDITVESGLGKLVEIQAASADNSILLKVIVNPQRKTIITAYPIQELTGELQQQDLLPSAPRNNNNAGAAAAASYDSDYGAAAAPRRR